MPRVHTATKSSRGREITCTSCRQPIEQGQPYYWWQRRNMAKQQRHQACGYPRPTELSSRKTAVLEEAIADAQNTLADWTPEVPFDIEKAYAEVPEGEYGEGGSYDIDTDEIDAIVGSVSETAREVGAEYEESADNMPESLQYGSQAEAMREVAGELDSWADNVEDWSSSSGTSVDVPDPADFDNVDDWAEAVQAAHDDVVEEMRQAASDSMDDMPEYGG